MIDFTTERVIRLTEAAPLLHVRYGTVHRWAKYGYRGRKLESAFLGGTAYTSLEAINRFSGQESQQPVVARLGKDHEDAMRDLARRGAKTRRCLDAKEKGSGANVLDMSHTETAVAGSV